MRFEVKRSEWYRGHGAEASALFVNPEHHHGDQCRCCLGFFGRACGLDDMEMRHFGFPVEMELPSRARDFDFTNWETVLDYDVTDKIVATNDDVELTDEKREEKLTGLFAKLGHEIVFVD